MYTVLHLGICLKINNKYTTSDLFALVEVFRKILRKPNQWMLVMWRGHLCKLTVVSSCSFEADNTSVDEPRELSDMKKHSEGTFSNDDSKYLEDRKAQDFVRWLMNYKGSGSVWDLKNINCEVLWLF